MTRTTFTEAEQELVRAAIVRLRARVMALSVAMLGGTGLSLATLWLLIRGGPDTGQHLGLLANYFPGYAVTWWGVGVGFVEEHRPVLCAQKSVQMRCAIGWRRGHHRLVSIRGGWSRLKRHVKALTA